MIQKLKQLNVNAKKFIDGAKTLDALRNAEIKLFGRKAGEFTKLMAQMKNLSDAQKKEVGKAANETKGEIESMLAKKRQILSVEAMKSTLVKESIDITEPALPQKLVGHAHPVSIVRQQLEDVFTSMGFIIEDGPELESEFYNFEGLNIPKDHPARDSQDTFYIKGHPNWLMRTHTSPVQLRAMQKYGAPLRTVALGRCFRNEATDAKHGHTFHQIEGLLIDKGISVAHLKSTLYEMVKKIFERDMEIRLRPGYFPFVEPGFELDIKYTKKDSGKEFWMEMLGCGLVHPNVLEYGGIDSKKYSGFAFGTGIERLALLKYEIDDLRLLQSGDMRFLEQF